MDNSSFPGGTINVNPGHTGSFAYTATGARTGALVFVPNGDGTTFAAGLYTNIDISTSGLDKKSAFINQKIPKNRKSTITVPYNLPVIDMKKFTARNISMLLIFFVIHISSGEAQAKKGSILFERKGLGCWEKTENINTIQYLCFKSGGNVESTNLNKREREGLGAIGYYMASDTTIEIIGFPGQGWMSRLYGNVCRWKIIENPQSLILDGPEDNCDIRGSWQRNDGPIGK